MQHKVLSFFLLLLLPVVGCTDGPGFGADSISYDVGDAGSGPAPDVDNSGTTFAQQYSTRVDSLQFQKPPASDLNGIVAVNLDQSLDEPIVILYEFSGLDADAGAASMRISSGTKIADGQYTPSADVEPVTSPLELDQASGDFSAHYDRFHFVATITFNGDTQHVDIPVTNLDVTGVLDLDPSGETATIPQGTWSGYVTKADGDATMVQIQGSAEPRPLTELFREETLDYDTNSEMEVDAGTGNAWTVPAQYTAVSATIKQ